MLSKPRKTRGSLFKGSLGPSYSIVSVIILETKHDWIEVLAYFYEYITMHDGITELGDDLLPPTWSNWTPSAPTTYLYQARPGVP